MAKEDLDSVHSNHKKNLQEDSAVADRRKRINQNQYAKKISKEFELLLKKYFRVQCRWDGSAYVNKKIFNNIKICCLLVRLLDPKQIYISSIQNGNLSLDILLSSKGLILSELIRTGILIIEPIRLSVKNDGKFIMSQTIGISLVHKNKYQFNQKYQEKGYPYKRSFAESIAIPQKMTENRTSNYYDLLVLILV